MRLPIRKLSLVAVSVVSAVALMNTAQAEAATMAVTVTVQNLAPANRVSLAPLRWV